jgi:hypothetical protein
MIFFRPFVDEDAFQLSFIAAFIKGKSIVISSISRCDVDCFFSNHFFNRRERKGPTKKYQVRIIMIERIKICIGNWEGKIGWPTLKYDCK